MKFVILIALLWFAGSYGCYKIWGTGAILPYAGITIVLAALAVWLVNKQASGK